MDKGLTNYIPLTTREFLDLEDHEDPNRQYLIYWDRGLVDRDVYRGRMGKPTMFRSDYEFMVDHIEILMRQYNSAKNRRKAEDFLCVIDILKYMLKEFEIKEDMLS